CILAWNNTLGKFGSFPFQVTEEIAAGFSGRLLKDILSENLPFIPPDQYDGFIEMYTIQEAIQMRETMGKLYPDVKRSLEILSEKYPLFIVSNCQKGYIENFLEQHGLRSYFPDFECFGNTGNPKRENIREIISRNQLSHPIYVGDTPGDYEASRWNQIPFIYASYGFGASSPADHRIDQFTDLIMLLESANKQNQGRSKQNNCF
ncbi:MAG: HAD family hydrolase, partial [Chitinophagales bacterium]